MRHRSLLASLALVGATGFFAGTVFSQDPGAGGKQDRPAFDPAQMAKMMELAQPGPEHKEIAKGAGTWDQMYTFWMMPGQPPLESKGTSENEMVLGGRFLRTFATGDMMGMKVESIGYVGFDRRREEFVTIGLDTMGTYFITAAGKKGDDGIIRLHGTDEDPTEGRQVYTFEIENVSDDEQVTRLFFSEMGGMTFDEPFKMVEIHAKRRP